MIAWRICKEKYVQTAFDGEGAKLYGGRWNSIGTRVVYTAENRSLAVLELLVHLDRSEVPSDFVLIPAEIPSDVNIEEIRAQHLGTDWDSYPAQVRLQSLGNRWIAESTSAALVVPSVVTPGERNILLNPIHADFSKIRIGDPERYQYDSRLSKP